MTEEQKPKVTAFDVVQSLNASFKEELKNPTDLIMDKARTAGVLPGQRKPPVGDKLNFDAALPQIPPIVIDGYELPRTNIPQMDALTVLMYIMAQELSNNPRIKSIFDQIQFKFQDAKGNVIFPKPQQPKAKLKKRNKRRNDKPTK